MPPTWLKRQAGMIAAVLLACGGEEDRVSVVVVAESGDPIASAKVEFAIGFGYCDYPDDVVTRAKSASTDADGRASVTVERPRYCEGVCGLSVRVEKVGFQTVPSHPVRSGETVTMSHKEPCSPLGDSRCGEYRQTCESDGWSTEVCSSTTPQVACPDNVYWGDYCTCTE